MISTSEKTVGNTKCSCQKSSTHAYWSEHDKNHVFLITYKIFKKVKMVLTFMKFVYEINIVDQ